MLHLATMLQFFEKRYWLSSYLYQLSSSGKQGWELSSGVPQFTAHQGAEEETGRCNSTYSNLPWRHLVTIDVLVRIRQWCWLITSANSSTAGTFHRLVTEFHEGLRMHSPTLSVSWASWEWGLPIYTIKQKEKTKSLGRKGTCLSPGRDEHLFPSSTCFLWHSLPDRITVATQLSEPTRLSHFFFFLW